MKRKALLLLLVGIMMLSLGSTPNARVCAFGHYVRVVFCGQPLPDSLSAVLLAGRTYIPVPVIETILGHNVGWDAANSTVFINSYDTAILRELPEVSTYKGYPTANVVVNGKLVNLAAPAIVYNNSPYLPLRVLEELGYEVGWDDKTLTAYIGSLTANRLPVVGSAANLEKMFAGQMYQAGLYRVFDGGMVNAFTAEVAPNSKSLGSDYSQTNVQVQGVDEADIIKTDGQYIYQVRNRQIIISKALPAIEMQVIKTIEFTDPNFYPTELYVDEKHLVVIGQSHNNSFYEELPEIIEKRGIDEKPSLAPSLRIAPGYWWWGNPVVKAIVYDVSNKADIKLIREVELEGNAVNSRKIGSHVYLLANKGMNYIVRPMGPLFKDTAMSEEYKEIGFDSVMYLPEYRIPNYLMIAAFDLNDVGAGTIVDALIGAGDNVYMSHNSLYVAVSRWHNNTTAVYKFAVDGTNVDYVAKGEVPGNVLNQFSMDEHKEYFRIATTNWAGQRSTNNVYVLDPEMKLAGKVEDIAPGERIYSARFMGDKGYLVTFEMVDPLFVLDLSNPKKPSILGALKIPGFSNYLHPLDEHHLLGIGKDTEVVDRKDHTGKVIGQFVIEKGMKLAIFDVSDVNNPKEKHVEMIGGRGTHSELLYNHKALLFDHRNGILAFPVTIYGAGTETDWGAFEFQGAIVYNVSLEQGFSLKGKISHITAEEYNKVGNYWYDGNSEVKRVLYIGENLYVVSNRAISAHNITSLAKIGRLNFE